MLQLSTILSSLTITNIKDSPPRYTMLSGYRQGGYEFHPFATEKLFNTFFWMGWRPENDDCVLNVSPSLHLSHCLPYSTALSYLSPLRKSCEKIYSPKFEIYSESIEVTNLILLVCLLIVLLCLCIRLYTIHLLSIQSNSHPHRSTTQIAPQNLEQHPEPKLKRFDRTPNPSRPYR